MEFTIVSEATLRPEDLIPAFASALDAVKVEYSNTVSPGSNKTRRQVRCCNEFLHRLDRRMSRDGYFESEKPARDFEIIETWFETLLPDGWYFGAIEGDGACFAIQKAEED